MANFDLKTDIYPAKMDSARKICLVVKFYIDDEEALRREVQDIVDAYNDYAYMDYNDMHRDLVDTINRRLKFRIDPQES